MLFWRCNDCGAEFPEPGDRTGFGQAMLHFRDPAGRGHHIEGLVNSEDGSLLVKGLSLREAIRLGYVQPAPGPARLDDTSPQGDGKRGNQGKATQADQVERETRGTAERGTDGKFARRITLRRHLAGRRFVAEGHRVPQPPAQPKTNPDMGREIPAPVSGVISSYTLVFPPEMLGLYAICREYQCKPDGSELGWDIEDVNLWVWSCVREYVEYFVPRAMSAEQGYEGKMAEMFQQQILTMLRNIQGLPAEAIEASLKKAVADVAVEGQKASA